MDTKRIESLVYQLLEALGENPDREGLVETPKRVAQMMEEMFEDKAGQLSGHDVVANDLRNPEQGGKTFDVDTNQMVIVKDITCFSHCEHHMALMYDMNISIGYIPRGRVIGLSKMPRIAEMCCKRLQLQEKIGEDIAEVISIATGTDDVIVHITSSHSCVSARGVKSANSKTTTLATKGIFEQDDMINRFLTLKNA
jgi:GTP cyclohydrolase I